MDIRTGFFYLFSAVLLFAAFRVITARNPVYAALYLVLAFFQAAAVWLLLRAEFLAITLVLVYVGAVMVLFLFVVMMLDINVDSLAGRLLEALPAGRHRRRADRAGDGGGADGRASGMGEEPSSRPGRGAGRRRSTPTPRNWASCCTASTCTRWRSRP